MTLVEMIFKEDFLVAIKLETLRVIAVYLLENKCRMNYINIIIYILIYIWYVFIGYVPYEMRHMIWAMIHMARIVGVSPESIGSYLTWSILPKCKTHILKAKCETKILCP